MIGIGLQMALALSEASAEREKATKYVAVQIGRVECMETSYLIGVYDSQEKAQAACDDMEAFVRELRKRQSDMERCWAPPIFYIFEWDGEIK